MRHELKIEFLSDTCFSMPAAQDDSVDVDVTTDADGLPLVSGKTLHGLLRDTWLSIQPYLDRENIGIGLMGRPRSQEPDGLLRIGDGRCGEEMRTWVRRLRHERRDSNKKSTMPPFALRDAFLLQRALTAENRQTGTPKTDTLRIVRIVPKDTVLFATLETARPLSPEHAELLLQLACLTRHAGIDRNRGMGHIQMTVMLNLDNTQPDVTSFVMPAANAENRFLHYRLMLTAPCLVTGDELDPNSRRTQQTLTGATLRGALAAALMRANANDADRDTELETVLASGRVRLLPAYPEVDGKRALPTPITWQRDKNAIYLDTNPKSNPRNALEWLANPDADDLEMQPEAVKSEFFAAVENEYHKRDVTIRHATHQSRDRQTGIATKDNATVFVYEALEAEQSFRGCLVAPPELEKRLRALFAPPLWLGRSARASYGGSPDVVFLPQTDSDAEKMGSDSRAEAIFSGNTIRAGSQFTFCLTSPAVLRDPLTGQHDPWQLGAAIEQRLREAGLGDAAEIVTGPEDMKMVCVEAGTAKGYNRLWRTEIPALPCAAAGSVALLEALRNISQDEIIALQQQPLGERIAEGMGCFVIAPARASLTLKDEQNPPEPPIPTGNPPKALMKAQRRLYRKRLRAQLTDRALEQAENLRGSISVSLLQRLRVPLRAPETFQATYKNWLELPGHTNNKKMPTETLNTLKQTRLAGQSLYQLLSNLGNGKPLALDREADMQREYALVPPSLLNNKTDNSLLTELGKIWNEEKQRLLPYYVDTLLSACARNKRRAEKTETTMVGGNE